MTTKDFLDRYDNKQHLDEEQLRALWWNELLDIDAPVVGKEEYGTPGRWNIPVSKVIKVEDRYFIIYRYQAATEYQEDEYDWQPDEVYPVEKTIVVWEGEPQK